MVTSSETSFGGGQTASSGLLSIKANQNLRLDLYSSKYDAFFQPLIKFLSNYPLATALSKSEDVPLALLSKAYSTARYEDSDSTIYFELGNQQSSITKSRFSRLLGFPQRHDLVDPETITNSAILGRFYNMGYKEYLAIISKFKKPNLPLMWNGLFTLNF